MAGWVSRWGVGLVDGELGEWMGGWVSRWGLGE